ncbi:MAG: nucleotide exchange factor GrpE [Candidatus Obscuribacterales bacterium]|nr:nucleotide exchange factor GrpE [Candidatus Obscuribacterales bacterium]
MTDTNKNQELPEEESSAPMEDSAQESPSAGGSRMNDAKAFFRALNAGVESNPSEMEMKTAESGMHAATACPSCEQLATEVQHLREKLSETDTHYKRMAADFENYRRRSDRDRHELETMGVKKMVEALMPALDDVDRAQMSLNDSMPADKILDSLKVVFNSLGRCLDQAGIKAMEPVGQPFDPRLHEPVQQIETTEFPDGYVMQELRRGYVLGDKVVRPALVNVASNRASAEEQQARQLAELQEQQNASSEEPSDELRDSGVYSLDEADASSEQAVNDYLEKLDDTSST